MKKLFLILVFLFVSNISYGQTVFTQTFVDRCTNEINIVTANFVNGSATVAFYNKVRTFTYQQYVNGELQQWLTETYNWWNTLSPCSQVTQQTQQAQQTAQTATQAATTATTAVSTATQNTGVNTSGTTQNSNTNSTTEGNNNGTSNTSESSSGDSGGGNNEGESSGGEESSSDSEQSDSEDGETESEGEESSEESEEDSEDVDEEDSEEEEEKKSKEMLPIQLRADMMSNQALLGNYDLVMSIGATKSSIFGDETYAATAMVWSNLNQFSLNTAYTKVNLKTVQITEIIHNTHSHFSEGNEVTSADTTTRPEIRVSNVASTSLGYMYNFGNGTILLSHNTLKPMDKWGTFGGGIMIANMFDAIKYQNTMVGYNLLYTNMVMLTDRIQYAPALVWTQTPYIGTFNFKNQLKGERIDGMIILANSFTIQLTRRFSFNAGATFIKSTNPLIPLIKSFMIGAKLPF